jgi:hypothetical protein
MLKIEASLKVVKMKQQEEPRNQPDRRPGSALGTDTTIFRRDYIFST